MSRQVNTELSAVANIALDCNGYSSEMIYFRANLCRIYFRADLCRNWTEKIIGRHDVILAGSKGEGVAKLFESDTDQMMVFRNFLCVDSGDTEDDITVIKAHSMNSPPGYTQLIPLDMTAEEFGEVFLMLTTVHDLTNGHILISSARARNVFRSFFRINGNMYEGIRSEERQPAGPSIPFLLTPGNNSLFPGSMLTIEIDNVFSMPYFSSTILETWKARDRKHQWPPHDVIREVSEMEGFVVPVGASFSEEQNFEWRICYTTAEQKLVLSLNPVMMKIYILLKMFFKEVVRPECDVISSYMIKNVVFWVAELNDSRIFTVENLVDIFLWCLSMFREGLHSNRLPNYMIPSRNLLYGKVTFVEKTKLMRILTASLNEGGLVVFRLKKLGCTVYTIERNLAKSYIERRNMIEKVFLEIDMKSSTFLSPTMILQPTALYDAWFEFYKDRSFLEMGLILMNLLNATPLSFAADKQHYMKLLKYILS